MKKTILIVCLLMMAGIAGAQEIKDTAAYIKSLGEKDYFLLDGKQVYGIRYDIIYKSRIPNQGLIISEINGNMSEPKLIVAFPANMSSSKPEPGTYNVMSGKKLGIKKGSGIAKIDIKPGLISNDNGGKIQVLYYNELFWFIGDDISITDEKTKEAHKLRFKISMFIQ